MEPDEEPPPAREPIKTYFDEKLGAWVKRYAPAFAEGSETRGTVLPRNYRSLDE